MRDADRILVGQPQGQTSFGRSEGIIEDNIKLNFIAVECEGVN
jgi:hypothetical protein